MNEKKKGFDLGSTLADVLGAVPTSDTSGPEKLEYIALDKLDEDVENFYSMDGLEELAANIELVGLQQPLRVRENPKAPGRFLIVSGHRRRRALGILYEEAPERWGSVPCIVERRAESDAMRELRLILANADTRRMSSADLSKQAERVEMLLYRLKEEGVEFPGRMRDHVAEACKVSKTKLATLKVIREKLIPEWKKLWEGNKINETVAYAIAQQPADVQRKIRKLVRNPEYMSEWRVTNIAKAVEAARGRKCKRSGMSCTHAEKMLDIEFAEQGLHSCSSYSCCLNCYNFIDCKFVCPDLAYVQLGKKREKKEARREQLAAEKAADQKLIDRAQLCWSRFGALRKEAGKTLRECTEARGDKWYDFHNADADEERENGGGKWSPHTAMPFGMIQADDVDRIIATADFLGCSTDYLLGRTDELQPAPAAPAAKTLQFHSGHPDHDAVCWCIFNYGNGESGCSGAIWKNECWNFYTIGATIDAECLGWIELPDYEGVLRK